LAFGDYHFHALHANGSITSYGTEPQACGALGLGGSGDPEGRLRGIRYLGAGRDGRLVPHAYAKGRQVWFQKDKATWIRFLASGGRDPDEGKERLRMMVVEPNVQGEVSEWVEQWGRDWDRRPGVEEDDEDGLGAHFALGVAAAGWHSGALVLVNEGLEKRVRESCTVEDPTSSAIDVGAQEEDKGKGREGEASPSSSSSSSSSSSAVTGQANAEEDPQDAEGVLTSALTTVWNSVRSFLGLSSSSASSAEEQQRRTDQLLSGAEQGRPSPTPFVDPVAHGASPEKGYKYIWAEDDFPRLRLSDGREMPGTVDWAEWREKRPVWDLSVEL
ncbi:hypothetical protein LTS18_009774, partial [Coniosporium uncinatum]